MHTSSWYTKIPIRIFRQGCIIWMQLYHKQFAMLNKTWPSKCPQELFGKPLLFCSVWWRTRRHKRLKVHVQFSMPTSKCWKCHVRTGIVHVCWTSPFIKYIELVPSSKQGRVYTGALQISCMILLSTHTSRIPCSIVRHFSYIHRLVGYYI